MSRAAIMGFLLGASSLTGAAAVGPAPAAGQARLQLVAGAASALPEGPRADAAFYGLAGLRVDWSGVHGSLWASGFGGLAEDDRRGSNFVSATAGGEAWTGPGTALGWVARASGFRVASPFTYRVLAARTGPALRLRRGRARGTLRTDLGVGTTLTELRRDDGRVRRAERDLWTRGADLELAWDARRWALAGFAGSWSSAGGPFRRAGAALTVGNGGWAVRVDAEAWDTPLGDEWLAGVALLVPLGRRTTLSASAGRVAPDPLTLVDSGDQGGLLLGWTLATLGGPPPPIVTVERSDSGHRARFRLDDARVRDATQVDVLGDFTAWAPVPLRRAGSGWEGYADVRPGVHHYGFQVDGEWWVPEGLPGNVPDEWGRTNATLVVSDESEEDES